MHFLWFHQDGFWWRTRILAHAISGTEQGQSFAAGGKACQRWRWGSHSHTCLRRDRTMPGSDSSKKVLPSDPEGEISWNHSPGNLWICPTLSFSLVYGWDVTSSYWDGWCFCQPNHTKGFNETPEGFLQLTIYSLKKGKKERKRKRTTSQVHKY